MTIIGVWLAYCVLIAALLTAGAAAWERAARWSMRPARWGWLAALAGSATLPWLLRLAPERGWTEALPGAPMLFMEPLVLSPGAAPAGWSVQGAALVLWAIASLGVLGYVGVVLHQLSGARRRWRSADIDGAAVFLTETMGPAAVGLRNASVVVPAWVLELDAELRGLLLKHEREHVEAGDPRLLLASLLLLAAMPWNPVVWLQVVRLRNAIELDCDARVLSAGADPERYGSLLLEVGRRRSTHALVLATFAEPRVFLAQRIRRIAGWPLEQHRGRAAAFTTAALVLFIGALSCDPVRIADVGEQSAVNRPTPRTVSQDSTQPVFTPMTQRPELIDRAAVSAALVENYPPLLRNAGIGGTPTVHLFIDTTGTVMKMLIGRSSGYPALDEAALRVARVMRFSSAKNRQEKVAVWVEIPIVFGESPAIRAADGARNPEIVRERVDPEARQRAAAPSRLIEERQFTPMTKAPELLNREDVRSALARSYPPLLRDAGIGGSPVAAVFVDTEGTVLKAAITRGSGYPALDAAALAVVRVMKFTPAENRGTVVPVWIEVPVVFTAQ